MLLELVAMPARAGRCASSSAKISRLTEGSLDDRFDGPGRPRRGRGEVGRRGHAARGQVGLRTLQLALLDAPVEPLTIRRHRSLKVLAVDVHEGHPNSVERRLLSDLGTHRAGADDEQLPPVLGVRHGRGHPIRPRPAT